MPYIVVHGIFDCFFKYCICHYYKRNPIIYCFHLHSLLVKLIWLPMHNLRVWRKSSSFSVFKSTWFHFKFGPSGWGSSEVLGSRRETFQMQWLGGSGYHRDPWDPSIHRPLRFAVFAAPCLGHKGLCRSHTAPSSEQEQGSGSLCLCRTQSPAPLAGSVGPLPPFCFSRALCT